MWINLKRPNHKHLSRQLVGRHLTFPVTTRRYIPWVEFVFPSENWPVITLTTARISGSHCVLEALPKVPIISLGNVRNIWLRSDLQKTPTCSKLSPPGCRRLTPVYSKPGHNPWCHRETNTYKSMMATWESGVYHLLGVWWVPSAGSLVCTICWESGVYHLLGVWCLPSAGSLVCTSAVSLVCTICWESGVYHLLGVWCVPSARSLVCISAGSLVCTICWESGVYHLLGVWCVPSAGSLVCTICYIMCMCHSE